MTDWEARVATAKRDGGWYGPDEEPSPYPPRIRRRRFLVSFALALVASVVAHALLHLVTSRPGPMISADVLLDGVVQGLLLAFFVGWSSTRPPRKKS